MRRRDFLRASACVGASTVATGLGAADGSVTTRDVEVRVWDDTAIAATVYEPPGDRPEPAVLMTHGYGGTRADLAGRARRYAAEDYLVLAYDSRGFGDSGGVSGFDGPKEIRDAQSLLTWLAAHDRVLTTGPENPRVGMDGGSYGGGIQLNVAAVDDRLDAIVPRITWHDLNYAAAPDGVVKQSWDATILAAGAPNGYQRDGRPDPNGPDPRLYGFVAESFATNEVPAAAREYFRRRSKAMTDTTAIDTPTLLLQGWPDNLLTPNQALWTFEGLRADDTETALVLFPGGHDAEHPLEPAAAGGSYVDDLALAWLDRHVRPGTGPEVPTVSYYDYQPERGGRRWRTAETFPPAAAESRTLDLAAAAATDRTPLVNPAAPTSVRGPAGALFGSPSADAPGGAASFDFAPTAPTEVVGRPRLNLPVESVGGEAHLFCTFEHVAGGRSRVIGEQVTATTVSGRERLDLECIAIQRHLVPGERLRVTLSTTDNGYASSREAAGVVLHHGDATVTLPAIGGRFRPVPPA